MSRKQNSSEIIFLFDVDGTLAESGQIIDPNMSKILAQLSNYGTLGIVGGGIYEKIKYQLNMQRNRSIDLF